MMRPAEEVCHEVQLAVWESDIVEAISEHLSDDLSYGDRVDLSLSF